MMDITPASDLAPAPISSGAEPASVMPAPPGFSPQYDQLAGALLTLARDDNFQNPKPNRHIQVYPRDGGSYQHSYTDLPGLLAHLRPVLAKNGLVLHYLVQDGAVVLNVIHAPSGQYLTSRAQVKPTEPGTHAMVSMITYMRRVLTEAALGVASHGDDDDGNRAAGRSFKDVGRRVVEVEPRDDDGEADDAPEQDWLGPIHGVMQMPATMDRAGLIVMMWDDATARAQNAIVGVETVEAIGSYLNAGISGAVARLWRLGATGSSKGDLQTITEDLTDPSTKAALDALPDDTGAALRRIIDRRVGLLERLFEAPLFDGTGDDTGRTYIDPDDWVRDYKDLARDTPAVDQAALQQHNADAIAEIQRRGGKAAQDLALLLDVCQAETKFVSAQEGKSDVAPPVTGHADGENQTEPSESVRDHP